MAEYLTSEQTKECKYYFDLLDKEGAGRLSIREIGAVMKSIGLCFPEEELKAIFKEIMPTGADTIDFPEFISMLSKKMKDIDTEEELKRVFREFDKTNKGYVTVEDLKEVGKITGEKFTVEELGEMLGEADVDHDGVLNYEDFARMMMAK